MGDAEVIDDIGSAEVIAAGRSSSGDDTPGRAGKVASFAAAIGSIRRGSRGSVYTRFRDDPFYLLKYYLANLGLLIAGSALIMMFSPRSGDFHQPVLWFAGLMLFVLPNFSLIFLSGIFYLALAAVWQPALFTVSACFLVPAGVLAGTISAALMHNAAHGNFRPRWTNRLWGEVCGLFQLTGFPGWTISHIIHHSTPDDPDKDAHPPGTMSLRAYANSMGVQMKDNITAKYREFHGRSRFSDATWGMVLSLVPATRYARMAFILLLCGPALFLWLYVPFKIANALIYIDFNYRTHRPNPDGDIEILNLDHTLWYKLLNAISFGSYFHKNHHSKWNVFNPKHVQCGDGPLITYRRPRTM